MCEPRNGESGFVMWPRRLRHGRSETVAVREVVIHFCCEIRIGGGGGGGKGGGLLLGLKPELWYGCDWNHTKAGSIETVLDRCMMAVYQE